MKPFLAAMFFVLTTVLLTVVCYMAAAGKGTLPLVVALLAYLGMFIRFGCISH